MVHNKRFVNAWVEKHSSRYLKLLFMANISKNSNFVRGVLGSKVRASNLDPSTITWGTQLLDSVAMVSICKHEIEAVKVNDSQFEFESPSVFQKG